MEVVPEVNGNAPVPVVAVAAAATAGVPDRLPVENAELVLDVPKVLNVVPKLKVLGVPKELPAARPAVVPMKLVLAAANGLAGAAVWARQ